MTGHVKRTLGLRWDADSTELSDEEPGVWWVDFWEPRADDHRLGGGGSQAVATKSEAVALITVWQERWPDHRLDLPGTLAWFVNAPERPEIPIPRLSTAEEIHAWQIIVDFHDDSPNDNPEYARGQIEMFSDLFGYSTDYKEDLFVALERAVKEKSRSTHTNEGAIQ